MPKGNPLHFSFWVWRFSYVSYLQERYFRFRWWPLTCSLGVSSPCTSGFPEVPLLRESQAKQTSKQDLEGKKPLKHTEIWTLSKSLKIRSCLFHSFFHSIVFLQKWMLWPWGFWRWIRLWVPTTRASAFGCWARAPRAAFLFEDFWGWRIQRWKRSIPAVHVVWDLEQWPSFKELYQFWHQLSSGQGFISTNYLKVRFGGVAVSELRSYVCFLKLGGIPN